jgi:hypothetical protein
LRRIRPHFGLTNKKKLFVEGFVLLRRLAEGPLSRAEAESELGIPYREWYRWLEIFKEAGIPLAIDYRYRKGTANEKTVRLWPQDWARLISPKNMPRPKPSPVKRYPTKSEILKTVQGVLKRVL